MLRAILLIATGGIFATASSATGSNDSATMVLHVQDAERQYCDAWTTQLNCIDMRPVVRAEPGDAIVVFVLLRNYDEVSGVRYLFNVDGGQGGLWGDWTMYFSVFGCLPGQTTSSNPSPDNGILETHFLCITGGTLEVIGLMVMRAGSRGCLGIQDCEFSGLWDCTEYVPAPVATENRGRVCVGSGGYDSCDPAPVPVAARTWGQIKLQYQ